MYRFFARRRDSAPPGPDSDDADLLAAVAAGRVEALRVLHRRHAPWLRARLARRCADPDVVDDALQDTFVAVWRGAAGYSPARGDAAAWIWTIPVRRLVTVLRGRGHRWIGDGHPSLSGRCWQRCADKAWETGWAGLLSKGG
ncbi:hypothetical protein Misp01_25310 [Microtetraspora sp. NBRC 13810]|uniref:RNA polymerase sigma factor n=1 Tax=Microtetraspora sp. NBRC 13810 TaxID=3030990 RepID=UPI0024A3723F|nr:sigma factor [Microtetraspora sp. NBRC 13810]GLW07401.1 hypothetical protein Misp01_25310 [Microtetraspora sp. NBRC 13810]